MKASDEDVAIRGKIDGLNPLSGGIVFGKEAAWEKLQVKMELKQERKIPLKLAVAIAACLILFFALGSAYFYYSSGHFVHDAGEQSASITKPVLPMSSISPSLTTTSETTQVKLAINAKEEINGREIVRTEQQLQNVVPVPQLPLPINIEAADTATLITNEPPALAVAQPMKVLHVNDLERGKPAGDSGMPIAANATHPAEIGRMPVVHINNVLREEQEILTIRRENRMSVGRIPFLKNNRSESYDNLFLSTPSGRVLFKLN